MWKNFNVRMNDMKRKSVTNNRLISQLKNNHELMDTHIKDLEKERDELLNEVEIYRNCNKNVEANQQPSNTSLANHNKHDELDLNNNPSNTQVIRDCKDKIFKFLINDKDKPNEEVRAGFYKSIVNLLKLANEFDEDKDSFDLSTLIEVYSQEGRKYFGPKYEFHEPDANQNDKLNIIKRPSRGLNKSETRLPYNNDLNMKSEDEIQSNDHPFTSLADNLSNFSKQRKGEKSDAHAKKSKIKSQLKQNKLNELTEQVKKLKAELEFCQSLLKEKTSTAAKGQTNNKLTNSQAVGQKLHIYPAVGNEELLQFISLLTQITESVLSD